MEFSTTRWSAVLAAKGDSSRAKQALCTLCEKYWYPLYGYLRRKGLDVHDAEDCLQGFFCSLLQRGHLWESTIDNASPQWGVPFRSFLLRSLQSFAWKERRKAAAQKRGGNEKHLSLDFASGEERYRLEPPVTCSPEAAFDRQWVQRLLESVLIQLREEYAERGNGTLFELLKVFLTGDEGPPYSVLAKSLDISPGAVKTAVYRLRRRYAALLREEVADTVIDPEEVEDELRQLFSLVSSENL